MPKAQAFKDELGINTSPRVYRKGYLFKEIGKDSNDFPSSYHDEKTMFEASYDNDVFGIFENLHWSEWDYSYGTEHEQMTCLPDDSQFFNEAWTKSTPSGSAGTPSLILAGSASTIRGNLKLTCTSSQTIAYAKSDIIDNINASTGCFTVEWALKKGNSESSNDNNFTIQIKIGQFHVQVIHGFHTTRLHEVGASARTAITNTNNTTISTISDGHYNKFRLVFDIQRSSKKCVLLINDQERDSMSKTQTNGATTDNEIKFGYLSTPTSTSSTIIKFIRYHNTAMYPIDVPVVSTFPIGNDINSTTTQGTETRYSIDLALAASGKFNTVLTSTDVACFLFQTSSTTSTISRSGDFSSNSIGNAVEWSGFIDSSSGNNGKLTYTLEDGTRSCNVEMFSINHTTSPGKIKFNGVEISGVSTNSFHKFRIVMKGTGNSSAINNWLYIDDILVASQSNTTSTANNKISIVCFGSGSITNNYVMFYIKLYNRPQFPTRINSRCVVSFLNGVTEATHFFKSRVVLNDLDDLLATPKLPSLQVFQKDLSWGDCGFDAMTNLEYRGSNTIFTVDAASPSYTSLTVSTGLSKRDNVTKFATDYFQVRMTFTLLTHELTFMRFHRQLDVSDYVTSWGSSVFERDFISRKINAGALSVKLMNPDDDFDTLRQRPDVWINAKWETWIGATTDSGDFEYPDFIGTVQDIIFDSNDRTITLQINNIIKDIGEININNTFIYPPFTKLNTFAGNVCNNVSTRQDSADSTVFYIDSKYDATISAIYVNGIAQTTGFVKSRNAPCYVDFTTAPNGIVTVDLIPLSPFVGTNAATLLRIITEKEAKLLPNVDIDMNALDTFETDVDGITVNNIKLSQTKFFDFLETLMINVSGDIKISTETQDSIVLEMITSVDSSPESITDRNLSNSLHQCESITINNPIENVINAVDITFDTESLKRNYTYYNTRLISDYDATSPISTRKIIDVFGIKSPTKRLVENTDDFFKITTHYEYITTIANLETVVDNNISVFGYRPALYELRNVHPCIFIYSLNDSLLIMRNSTVTPDDSIEITRIEKDYDNLTGTIQGFSNKFIQL